MKKSILSILMMLAFVLTACTNQNTTQEASNPSLESLIILDEGVWPENKYTEGIAVPPGTVSWAVLEPAQGYCGVNLIDLTDDAFKAYMELLKENGFSVIEEVSEEMQEQNYVSIGTILSNGDKAMSISYIPGNLSIYISIITEPAV